MNSQEAFRGRQTRYGLVTLCIGGEMGIAAVLHCRVHDRHDLTDEEWARSEPLLPDRTNQVQLLLTLGSPLGLRAIRHLLPDPGFGTGPGGPPNVRRWVNLQDRRDRWCWWSSTMTPWTTAAPRTTPRYLGKRH
jgi:hypothetical protein